MFRRALVALSLFALFFGSTVLVAQEQLTEQQQVEAEPDWKELERLLLERAEKGIKGPFPGCDPVGTVVESMRRSPAAYERLTGRQRALWIQFMYTVEDSERPYPFEPYEIIWGLTPDGETLFVLAGPPGWICVNLTEKLNDGTKERMLRFVKGRRT